MTAVNRLDKSKGLDLILHTPGGEIGLKIESLEGEENKGLQDAVLSVHHWYNITFSMSGAVSIIENHLGSCYVNQMPAPALPMVFGQPPNQ